MIITQPGETAEGDSGVYDLAAGKMVLIGNVVLTQRQERGQGRPRWTWTCNTGVSMVTASRPAEGGSRAQRVRALFVPEPEAGA